MNNHFISICIPTYNSGNYIFKTLISLLNQTYSNFEIIISDNCSSDNTFFEINKLMLIDKRIKYFKQSNKLSFAQNCNFLIKKANYEIIALFHSDDIYLPSIIEESIKLLSSNPELGGCFSTAEFIDSYDRLLTFQRTNISFLDDSLDFRIINLDEYLFESILNYGSILICPSAVIRKSVYLAVGLFDEKIVYLDDQDLYIRILERFKLGVLKKRLIKYRVHNKQYSTFYISEWEKNDIPISLLHFKNYIYKDKDSNKNLLPILNQQIAKVLLDSAYKFWCKFKFHKAKKLIHESKKYFVFKGYQSNNVFQNHNTFFGFFIFRFLIRIIKRILDFLF